MHKCFRVPCGSHLYVKTVSLGKDEGQVVVEVWVPFALVKLLQNLHEGQRELYTNSHRGSMVLIPSHDGHVTPRHLLTPCEPSPRSWRSPISKNILLHSSSMQASYMILTK